MARNGSENRKVFLLAAWIWMVYLALQALIDLTIYGGRLGGPQLSYYIAHGLAAVVFLIGSTYRPIFIPEKIHTALLILLISLAGILINPLFNLRLPQAPLSNIEGMVLRQVPILMIALILTAWHYPLKGILAYTFLLSLAEFVCVLNVERMPADRQTAFTFILVIRTLCSVLVGIFINKLISTLRKQQQALELANQNLAHYAVTMEQLTLSRERNRMSRELHDTVIHSLSGLSVQLETILAYLDVNPEVARQLLNQSLQVTRDGLTETRRAIKSLRATQLDDLGLLRGIRELASLAGERAGLDIHVDLPETDPLVPPDVEQVVYRIAQEAITNIVQHANAHRLKLSIQVDGKDLTLQVEDDGTGFRTDANFPAGHYGLTGMIERADMVGASLQIDSKPNSGTRIRLVVKGCVQ